MLWVKRDELSRHFLQLRRSQLFYVELAVTTHRIEVATVLVEEGRNISLLFFGQLIPARIGSDLGKVVRLLYATE